MRTCGEFRTAPAPEEVRGDVFGLPFGHKGHAGRNFACCTDTLNRRLGNLALKGRFPALGPWAAAIGLFC